MPGWREAVQEAPGGARLLLEVTAGASLPRFPDGFNAWREGRIGIRVKSPAQEGRANAEVVTCLAAFFAHPTARIHIESGAASSRKSVRVMGLGAADVATRLAPHLGAP